MNLFLYLFYQAAKALTRLVLGVFYAKTVVTNRKNLAYQNPGIVVSNHPNALLDPLHVASRTQKIQFFLANITMFQHPISNWFFSTFYCIPIERPKDIQGRGVQNKASFEKCDEFLTGGGSLYIAPQGAMELKRRIEKVKTGTARIALSAEQKNDFQLGMTILPVGLNYSAANDFRSQLLINVGEPLLIKDYAQAYQQDPIQTVRQLTADLKSRMGELIITTQDEAEDELLYQIETLQATNEPLEMSPTFKRSKQTLKQLRAFDEQNPTGYQALKEASNQYFSQIATLHTSDASVVKAQSKPTFGKQLLDLCAIIIGFPFFLYGWFNNYLACYLPALLARKMNLFIGYTATVKTLSSIFIFPIIYGLQAFFVQYWGGHIELTIAYLLSLYPLGLFAWWYNKRWQQKQKDRRYQQLIQKNSVAAKQLYEKRQWIIQVLSELRTIPIITP